MKCKPLLIILSSMLMQSAIAVSSRPEKCPSVASIAAVSVDSAGQGTHVWMAFPASSNYYDTKELWSFGIFVPASSREEALETAKASIKKMGSAGNPYHDDDTDSRKWACSYATYDANVTAFAFTPPIYIMK